MSPQNAPHDSTTASGEEMELIQQPLIIGILCGLSLLAAILMIVAICYICKRFLQNSPRSAACNNCNTGDHRGFYPWHGPPPYYPPDVNGQAERHQCACQTQIEAGPLPFTTSWHNNLHFPHGHGNHRNSGPDGEHMSIDRRVAEFPLLQTPTRDVLNPVYSGDTDVEETSRMIAYGSTSRQRNVLPENQSHDQLADLYKVTERSFTQTVCGKLVVSVAKYVDHNGDTLILDNMGISLRVPQGAIKPGQKHLISLVLNWDLSDNPHMTDKQSLVSPVVYIGPHGLKLKKPCTLSFRHCAFDTRHIRVMRSETELTEEKKWEAVSDKNDKSVVCYLTQDECQLTVDRFTLYTCVQSPLDDQTGKKWLQIAVFACPLRREINHHQV